jgi:hypothetical protein
MTEPLYPPRWMRRIEAARWVGMSPTKFDQLVKDERARVVALFSSTDFLCF